jgi:hypothetical protein
MTRLRAPHVHHTGRPNAVSRGHSRTRRNGVRPAEIHECPDQRVGPGYVRNGEVVGSGPFTSTSTSDLGFRADVWERFPRLPWCTTTGVGSLVARGRESLVRRTARPHGLIRLSSSAFRPAAEGTGGKTSIDFRNARIWSCCTPCVPRPSTSATSFHWSRSGTPWSCPWPLIGVRSGAATGSVLPNGR